VNACFCCVGFSFSVPSQQTGSGKRLRNDLFCVEWHVKPQLDQSIGGHLPPIRDICPLPFLDICISPTTTIADIRDTHTTVCGSIGPHLCTTSGLSGLEILKRDIIFRRGRLPSNLQHLRSRKKIKTPEECCASLELTTQCIEVSVFSFVLYYSAADRQAEYRGDRVCVSVCVCVCLSVRTIISSLLDFRSSPISCACYLYDRGSVLSGGVVIRYVLPVLWITSYLLISQGCSTSPRPAEAQCTRSLGLGYEPCAVIPVAGQRTHGTTFRALKVTSQLTAPGVGGVRVP